MTDKEIGKILGVTPLTILRWRRGYVPMPLMAKKLLKILKIKIK